MATATAQAQIATAMTVTPLPPAAATPTLLPPASTYWPTEGWRTSTPEQQGMDSELLVKMFDHIKQEDANIHSVLIIRNGYIVAEAYFYPLRQDIKHKIHSCTKSFTSALVGIAIHEGYIDGVDHRVLDFFPERTVANSDPRKQAMTLEHLLTMTSGLDWPELSVSYSSPTNVNEQMTQSQDWVQFVLDRPMVEEPGTAFNYNTGGSHLLSAIIHETTGMNALSFAQARLFEPLGISDVSWSSDPDGVSYGGDGILMTPRDMAKFGYLYLKGGVWDGQQIVPADWVEASATKHVETVVNIIPYYGYQWWVHNDDTYAAFGYGGQYILVIPDLEMVVAFTGGLQRVDFGLPQLLVDNFIIPAAKSSEPLPENPQGAALLESRINEIEQLEP